MEGVGRGAGGDGGAGVTEWARGRGRARERDRVKDVCDGGHEIRRQRGLHYRKLKRHPQSSGFSKKRISNFCLPGCLWAA